MADREGRAIVFGRSILFPRWEQPLLTLGSFILLFIDFFRPLR